MALINCPECGKEISDSAKVCIHCGYKMRKKESVLNKIKGIDKRKLQKLAIGIVAIVLCFIAIAAFNKKNLSPIEIEAEKYIQELKEIDNVKKINAVVCLSNEVKGENNVPGYLILYSTKTTSQVAYFFRGEYKGNGYNEDYIPNGSNILSLMAVITALEFIEDNGLSKETGKRFYEVEEGKDCIAYIDLRDIAGWLENW